MNSGMKRGGGAGGRGGFGASQQVSHQIYLFTSNLFLSNFSKLLISLFQSFIM